MGQTQGGQVVNSARNVLIEEVQLRLVKLDLSGETQRAVIGLIQRQGERIPAPGTASLDDRFIQLRVARDLYRTSLRRTDLLGPKLASDTVTNMLLALFIAHEEGRGVSVSSLCIASGGPPTTALRQIRRMEDEALVRRYADSQDGRRTWVSPTDKALDLTRDFIAEMRQLAG
jgi:DNA-binding MarR family transcriptional regulator